MPNFTKSALMNELLKTKHDLQENTDLQLAQKYKTSDSEAYKAAIITILKERGFTQIEIGQLIDQ
ncbi:hypothetical protein [Acinetobacter stercoris]|uniref:Uncharacterized protein n=1 Tax=Acinetobacter stercoris TaxID=2126983 RepID=A0A2U3N476_9GAMM|nr:MULTISPECIES: hypothetical protein [Acinetobacter]SPL72462.1 hypothetical protein KPC_3640 [Acinetobacter stercoris]